MVRFGSGPAVVDPLLIDAVVVVVLGVGVLHIQIGGSGQSAAVGGGSGDGTGVHQGNRGHLTLAGLGALPVGEVPGGVTDGELAVGGGVARAEAGTAEAFPQDRACGDQVVGTAVAHQLGQGGHGAGVDAEGEGAVAAAAAPQDIGGGADIVKGTARAAGDLALLHPDSAVVELGDDVHLGALDLLVGVLLNQVQDVFGVLLKLVDGVGIGGVHGHGNGGLNGGEVNVHAAVVVSNVRGLDLFVSLGTAVDGEVAPGLLVGDPDGGPAGGLGGHNVNGVPELHRKILDAGANELHDLVFHIAVLVHSAADAQGYVVGADAGLRRAGQVNGNDAGAGEVISPSHQLLGQFAAALADGHGAQSAVAGVGIGAKDHSAAARHGLPVVGMDVCHVGGHIDAAVLVGSGQGELVVVLVDGAAYGAEGIVAVGQHIGQGELGHAGGPGGLDNAHIGDVVGSHGVKLQLQVVHIPAVVVGLQNAVGHGAPGSLFPGDGLAGSGRDLRGIGNDVLAVYEVNTGIIQVDHLGFILSFLLTSS